MYFEGIVTVMRYSAINILTLQALIFALALRLNNVNKYATSLFITKAIMFQQNSNVSRKRNIMFVRVHSENTRRSFKIIGFEEDGDSFLML